MPSKLPLTDVQRHMYASEKLVNFRWIAKLVATYSPYILSKSDQAEEEVRQELAEIGQFAEIVYSQVPIDFLLNNFEKLNEKNFPLEGYHRVGTALLSASFRGAVAGLPGFVVYYPPTKQLIVAISGTSRIKHGLQDIRFLKSRHSSGRGLVHAGFWAMYQGIKSLVLDAIKRGLVKYQVDELVITGHSMGGSVSYLLCMDILEFYPELLPKDVICKLVVFGAPRAGDPKLVEHWRSLVSSHRERNGASSLIEYSVKTWNDGVPSLPPTRFGYRHFAQNPLYTVGGRLYLIPSNESEHSLFHVQPTDESRIVPEFPRGGHNYYNGRELEKFLRRIAWLDKAKPDRDGWEARYKKRAEKDT